VTMRAALLLAILLETSVARARPFEGPGLYCGYATKIMLAPGETLSVTDGGMHSNGLVWTGDFGSLDITEINWAAKPQRILEEVPNESAAHLFLLDRIKPRFALWDGGHLAVYFSGRAFNRGKTRRALLSRISLADHAGAERNPDCKFGAVFSFE